ncbi:MAG: hypothetical protein RIQ81_1109 [Pseudomonadota bacterium]
MKHDPWEDLRKLTHARIALGRAGHSVPTRELLDFRLAHSRARDAVWLDVDFRDIAANLVQSGVHVFEVESNCRDKQEFLLNPDLGRRLSSNSVATLRASSKAPPGDCTLVVADGLSANAVHRNATGFCLPFIRNLADKGLRVNEVVLARHARVALGDEIGETLQAKSVLVLIGERPGLATAESLSVYFTWGPGRGKTDAQRNCISNIHAAGLPAAAAASMAAFLVHTSLSRQISGVDLKVEYPAIVPQNPS